VDRPELKLVGAPEPVRRTPAAAAMATALVAAALLATWAGADAARRKLDPASLVEQALTDDLSGNDPQAVDDARVVLRRRLAATPLDATARTALANLEVEVAPDAAGREAAARQAVAATRLVGSDEWVSRAAARVLARCGRGDLALAEIETMFRYAPAEAAVALTEIEPFVASVTPGIPDLPQAWLAWSIRLREAGREDEADAWIASLLRRWPGDLRARSIAAGAAAGRNRIDELSVLVPPAMELPATREAGALHAYRARTKAAAGDIDGARADVAQALALAPDDPWVYVHAGDAAIAFDDAAAARDYWTRALYALDARPAPERATVWVRYRLARLDDREGKGASALRNWRSILAARPDSEEARRRVAELTGGNVP
jgi:tetratricopeptide (TPR) repeat protein